jgi:hypothetical protein
LPSRASAASICARFSSGAYTQSAANVPSYVPGGTSAGFVCGTAARVPLRST